MYFKKKSEKILEICGYPPPRSGWSVRVVFVSEVIRKEGHVCDVLNISPFSRKIPSKDYLTTVNGFDYLIKIFRKRFKGYRIHMHLNGDSPKGFILTILALISSLLTFHRPIITFHAGPYQKYFPQDQASLLTPMYKFIFTSSKKIICNDEAVKKKIVGYGINPSKIYPIQAFSIQYLNYTPLEFNGELKTFIKDRYPVVTSYFFFRPEFFVEKMMEGIQRLTNIYPNLGLIIISGDTDLEKMDYLIKHHNLEENIFFVGDQTHDSFLTLISNSHIYLRTPVKDGVCSSVLEALTLGVPVIASENRRRPASVITYNHKNIDDFVKVMKESIERLPNLKDKIVKPPIPNTVADEVSLLLE